MAPVDADLTAAARIRDAALREFAARGVSATSIRDVARAAKVSPGLVQHHFRSKAGLRRAVEEFVTRRAIEALGNLVPDGSPAETTTRIAHRISAFIRENPAAFAYIGRSLLEGDAAGVALFESLLGVARAQIDRFRDAGLLRADLDLDWTVLHVVLIDVGAYLLEAGLVRYLGESPRSERGLERMERATAALFLRGIFRPDEDRPTRNPLETPAPPRRRSRRTRARPRKRSTTARQSSARRRSTRTE
jgi:AcrR family transcriptional regulator